MANTIVEVRLAAATDDAEENTATGGVSRSSTDLELTRDGSKNQLIGMRFNGLAIPPDAVIVNAYLQFTVDEVSTGAASLAISGEDTDNAQAYTSLDGDISSRAATTASGGMARPGQRLDAAGLRSVAFLKLQHPAHHTALHKLQPMRSADIFGVNIARIFNPSPPYPDRAIY